MNWLRRIFCFHTGPAMHITNYMTSRGPRRLFKCNRCDGYFTESW